MAGDWIKMRTSLGDDPAVTHIALHLRISSDTVVGKLHRIWSWTDQHSDDGTCHLATAEWLDDYVRQPGFAAAMASAGWLVITENSLVFPGYCEHNGATAKARAQTAKRVKRSRNGATVTKALPEKRREEKNIDLEASASKSCARKAPKRFVKPTQAEVAAYIAEKSYAVDAERWYAHYEANGWRVGKNPMKDWKAAVRVWHGNSGDYAPRAGPAEPYRPGSRALAKLGIRNDQQ